MLNNDSRSRSAVGRNPAERGPEMGRERKRPPTTLITLSSDIWASVFRCGCGGGASFCHSETAGEHRARNTLPCGYLFCGDYKFQDRAVAVAARNDAEISWCHAPPAALRNPPPPARQSQDRVSPVTLRSVLPAAYRF